MKQCHHCNKKYPKDELNILKTNRANQTVKICGKCIKLLIIKNLEKQPAKLIETAICEDCGINTESYDEVEGKFYCEKCVRLIQV